MLAILGATGKIGRATVRALRGQGVHVQAVVRDAARAGDLGALGCELAVADLEQPDGLVAAFQGADAAQVICPITPRAEDAVREMEQSIARLGAALDRARVPHVLAISDYGAEVPDGTGVTLLFHRLEQRLARLNGRVTFLRSAEHMQNWARFAGGAVANGVLTTLHAPVTKEFPVVSAPDVGIVAAELLTDGDAEHRRIVHVEGPRRYTSEEVAAILGRLAGRPITARALAAGERVPALLRGGVSASYAQLVADLYDAHNAGRIDAERGAGPVRRGTTTMDDVLAPMVATTKNRPAPA